MEKRGGQAARGRQKKRHNQHLTLKAGWMQGGTEIGKDASSGNLEGKRSIKYQFFLQSFGGISVVFRAFLSV